ncbi:TraB/GumN family protein [Myroides sp. 1354]|uniref:TraB/GumN family protein n=1 Tax=unclassified Myroides TaxID=2642485 RepID=UPI0025772011|nr:MULTISPECIES: TraB/GumN family protein [unclassified Myroides]MDM1045172.1 TraB/GumN family protein [Myroides sp. R163-1]MDM1056054.1 TraB/GumN family protein [Myroides sp. 1354]MDM1069183.1 TraB/GumN family protein [Myroides sp. 1372]
MKRLLLIIFFLIFFFSPVWAQENLEKSLLWEIKGKGLKTPSYLLGTFHMVCVEDLRLTDKVVNAIEVVDQIALEVNLTDPQEMSDLQQLMFATTSLSSQLNKEEQKELRELLKKQYNLDLATVDYLAPIGLLGLMAMKAIPCEVKGYDMEVMEEGLRKNRSIIGLEQFKDQIEITSAFYTAKEILAQLKVEDDFEANYKLMARAFQEEDLVSLYESATDPQFLSAEGKLKLLDERNIQWVAKMEVLMSKQPTLFAVGAGHLAGNQGVIQLLRNLGFTVTAVLN